MDILKIRKFDKALITKILSEDFNNTSEKRLKVAI